MSDATAKFDMKIPAFALAGALLGGAGMFYGVQARVSILEVKAEVHDKQVDKYNLQVDAIKAEAEASRTRMQQSVSEIRELLIELRGNSRRLEEKLEMRMKQEKQ